MNQPANQSADRDLINIKEMHGNLSIINDARLFSLSITLNETQPPLRDWQQRSEEETIAGYFADRSVRVVGISGAGGYGKSALAARMFEQATGFKDRFWANFQQPVSFSTFGRWLGRKFGFEPDEQWTDDQLTSELLNCLSQSRYFLVLDNLETLLQPDELWQPYQNFLTRWLGMGGGGTVLITTQRRINLPTDCWEWLELKGLELEQGVALLRQRQIRGSEADLRQFVALAGGHPLLLSLAATVLRKRERQDQEPAAIHTLQTDDLTLLRQIQELHRDDPEASVGAVLDVGYGQLPPKLQGVLRRVSVYRLAEFDLEMAQAMLPEPLEEAELRMLARWSFLVEKRQAQGWRFLFQPLIQCYFRQVLREAEEGEVAQNGAIAYFAAHRQNPLPVNVDRAVEEAATVAYVEMFHHLCELGQYARAFESVFRRGEDWDDLEDFLKRRGFNSIRVTLFGRLVQEWQPQAGEYGQYRDALLVLGSALQLDDQRDRAMELYEWFLPLACEADDRLGEANTLLAIADVLQFKDRRDEALVNYERALTIFQEINARLGEANTLKAIADVLQFKDRRDEALVNYERALTIFQEINARLGEANTLDGFANFYYSQGDYQQAVGFYSRAAAIFAQINSQYDIAWSLAYAARCQAKLNQPWEATQTYEAAQKIFQAIGLEEQAQAFEAEKKRVNQAVKSGSSRVAPRIDDTDSPIRRRSSGIERSLAIVLRWVRSIFKAVKRVSERLLGRR